MVCFFQRHLPRPPRSAASFVPGHVRRGDTSATTSPTHRRSIAVVLLARRCLSEFLGIAGVRGRDRGGLFGACEQSPGGAFSPRALAGAFDFFLPAAARICDILAPMYAHHAQDFYQIVNKSAPVPPRARWFMTHSHAHSGVAGPSLSVRYEEKYIAGRKLRVHTARCQVEIHFNRGSRRSRHRRGQSRPAYLR